MRNQAQRTKLITVLRSGGDFTPEYVGRLRAQVDRHCLPDIDFCCITDLPADAFGPRVRVVRLEHDWPGWWSKLEMFLEEGPALYLDLDTVVVGDLSVACFALQHHSDTPRFWMLKPFRPTEQHASGVMAWTGDWSWITGAFRGSADIAAYRWDQRFISATVQALTAAGTIGYVQNDLGLDGIVSYKHHVRARGIPAGTRIICFHGRPRPHEVGWLEYELEKHHALC